MKTSYLVFSMTVVFSTSILTGCGGGSTYEGPQRAEVLGTVTLDGKPVENGSINFQPRDQKNRPAGAVIAGGQYTIPEGKGPNFGEYDVYISAKTEGEEVPEVDDEGEPTGEITTNSKELVPSKYNEETELKVTISESPQEESFELKSK